MLHERRSELVRLTEAATAVALSVLLGNIRLVELPNGGSLALSTVPLLALAVARGPRLGLLAGACAGAAHALAGGTIVHPVQLGLDYLLAYALLGLAGIAGAGTHGAPRVRMLAPITLAMCAHLAVMVVSGVVFFAPSAGSAALAYSLGYNALTVVPETVLAWWLVPGLVLALARANPGDSWRRGLLPPPRVDARRPRAFVPRPQPEPQPHPQPRPPLRAVPRPAAPLVRATPAFGRTPFATLRFDAQRGAS